MYFNEYVNNGGISVSGGVGKASSTSYYAGGNGGAGSISVGCIGTGSYISTYTNY